jgi:hypothetical protein
MGRLRGSGHSSPNVGLQNIRSSSPLFGKYRHYCKTA